MKKINFLILICFFLTTPVASDDTFLSLKKIKLMSDMVQVLSHQLNISIKRSIYLLNKLIKKKIGEE